MCVPKGISIFSFEYPAKLSNLLFEMVAIPMRIKIEPFTIYGSSFDSFTIKCL